MEQGKMVRTGYDNYWLFQNFNNDSSPKLSKSNQFKTFIKNNIDYKLVQEETQALSRNEQYINHLQNLAGSQNNTSNSRHIITSHQGTQASQTIWNPAMPEEVHAFGSSFGSSIQTQDTNQTSPRTLAYSFYNTQSYPNNYELERLKNTDINLGHNYNSNSNYRHSDYSKGVNYNENITMNASKIRVKDVFSINNALGNQITGNSLYQVHESEQISYPLGYLSNYNKIENNPQMRQYENVNLYSNDPQKHEYLISHGSESSIINRSFRQHAISAINPIEAQFHLKDRVNQEKNMYLENFTPINGPVDRGTNRFISGTTYSTANGTSSGIHLENKRVKINPRRNFNKPYNFVEDINARENYIKNVPNESKNNLKQPSASVNLSQLFHLSNQMVDGLYVQKQSNQKSEFRELITGPIDTSNVGQFGLSSGNVNLKRNHYPNAHTSLENNSSNPTNRSNTTNYICCPSDTTSMGGVISSVVKSCKTQNALPVAETIYRNNNNIPNENIRIRDEMRNVPGVKRIADCITENSIAKKCKNSGLRVGLVTEESKTLPVLRSFIPNQCSNLNDKPNDLKMETQERDFAKVEAFTENGSKGPVVISFTVELKNNNYLNPKENLDGFRMEGEDQKTMFVTENKQNKTATDFVSDLEIKNVKEGSSRTGDNSVIEKTKTVQDTDIGTCFRSELKTCPSNRKDISNNLKQKEKNITLNKKVTNCISDKKCGPQKILNNEFDIANQEVEPGIEQKAEENNDIAAKETAKKSVEMKEGYAERILTFTDALMALGSDKNSDPKSELNSNSKFGNEVDKTNINKEDRNVNSNTVQEGICTENENQYESKINRKKLEMLIEFLESDTKSIEECFSDDYDKAKDQLPQALTSSSCNKRKNEDDTPNQSRRKLSKNSVVRNRNKTKEMISLGSHKIPKIATNSTNDSKEDGEKVISEQKNENGNVDNELNEFNNSGSSISTEHTSGDTSSMIMDEGNISISKEKINNSQDNSVVNSCSVEESSPKGKIELENDRSSRSSENKKIDSEECDLINMIKVFQKETIHKCSGCDTTSPNDCFWINVMSMELRCFNCFKKVIKKKEEFSKLKNNETNTEEQKTEKKDNMPKVNNTSECSKKLEKRRSSDERRENPESPMKEKKKIVSKEKEYCQNVQSIDANPNKDINKEEKEKKKTEEKQRKHSEQKDQKTPFKNGMDKLKKEESKSESLSDKEQKKGTEVRVSLEKDLKKMKNLTSSPKILKKSNTEREIKVKENKEKLKKKDSDSLETDLNRKIEKQMKDLKYNKGEAESKSPLKEKEKRRHSHGNIGEIKNEHGKQEKKSVDIGRAKENVKSLGTRRNSVEDSVKYKNKAAEKSSPASKTVQESKKEAMEKKKERSTLAIKNKTKTDGGKNNMSSTAMVAQLQKKTKDLSQSLLGKT